jgi:hypothetical protein
MAPRALLLVPALLLSTATAHADAAKVTLGAKAPPVGAKYTEEKSAVFELTVRVGAKTLPIKVVERQEKTVEVLAIKGEAITKAKIAYVHDLKSKQEGANQEGGVSPIEGKTYTLTAGAPVQVDGAAGAAPDAEAAVVRDREKHFGELGKMTKVLAGLTFPLGKPVEIASAEMGDAFGDDPNLELKKLVFTYRAMNGKNAKFDVELVLGSRKPDVDLKFSMRGTALIDPSSGAPIELALDGTVKQTGKTQIDGTAKLTAHRTL